jgi:hypothetical protein
VGAAVIVLGVDTDPPRLFDVLPTVATALRESLVAEGELALADDLGDARVYALCECSAQDCMSFYLSAPLPGPCPGEFRVVMPSAVMTIGVCEGHMGWVQDEIQDESDAETQARRREYQRLEGIVPRAPQPAD